jgi:hypothetical protein
MSRAAKVVAAAELELTGTAIQIVAPFGVAKSLRRDKGPP